MTTTRTAATTATLVREYRARIATDPETYEGDIDVIMWLVNDTAGRDWTPSQIGRAIGVDTTQAAGMLQELARDGHIAADGNGAWTHYIARHR